MLRGGIPINMASHSTNCVSNRAVQRDLGMNGKGRCQTQTCCVVCREDRLQDEVCRDAGRTVIWKLVGMHCGQHGACGLHSFSDAASRCRAADVVNQVHEDLCSPG